MVDFHKGDVVYVPEIGSTTTIERLLLTQGVDGSIQCHGYETEFGTLSSSQMKLISAGRDRILVETYLEDHRND